MISSMASRRVEALAVQSLHLERAEQRFTAGVVPAITAPAHGRRDAVLVKQLVVVVAGVLGEFDPSSQHFLIGGVDELEEVEVRSIGA